MSALLEALRLCKPLAPAVREQVQHQVEDNAHDAETEEPPLRRVRMWAGDFGQQVAARERYYAERYGDAR